MLEAYEHESYPFDKIVEDINPALTLFSNGLLSNFVSLLPSSLYLTHGLVYRKTPIILSNNDRLNGYVLGRFRVTNGKNLSFKSIVLIILLK